MTTETFVLKGRRPVITKDPNAVLDYTLLLSDWLSATPGDTILSATVPVLTGGIAVGLISVNPTDVTIWVSGGTVAPVGATGDAAYASATVRIVTVGGRVDDRTLYFKIRER